MEQWSGKFEMVDPRVVVVDHRYQREEKSGLVAAIASSPSWEAFGCLVLFKRGSVYYCADGQQRLRGVLSSETPPKQVPGIIFEVAGIDHEAEIFVRINEWRKSLTPIEKHKGKIVAKDAASLAIESAVEKAGFSIGPAGVQSPRSVGAIAALHYVYNELGEDGVVQILTLCRAAWPDDRKALDRQLLRVLTDIVSDKRQNGGYERGKMTAALARTTPASLFRKAEEIHFEQGTPKKESLRRAFKVLARV